MILDLKHVRTAEVLLLLKLYKRSVLRRLALRIWRLPHHRDVGNNVDNAIIIGKSRTISFTSNLVQFAISFEIILNGNLFNLLPEKNYIGSVVQFCAHSTHSLLVHCSERIQNFSDQQNLQPPGIEMSSFKWQLNYHLFPM